MSAFRLILSRRIVPRKSQGSVNASKRRHLSRANWEDYPPKN